MHLRVMTWNVFYKERADNVLSLISKIKPDILCCQEITTNSHINPGRDIPREVNKIIGGDYRYMSILPSLNNQPANFGNAIFSKLPINSHRQILVQHGGPDINISLQNRGYLEVNIQVEGRILTVGCTHLSYVDGFVETEARSEEADRLLKFIAPNKRSFIIGGDFNSSPTSSTVKKMEHRLKSVGPPYGELTFTTKPFKNGDFQVDTLEWRLDYIFATADIKVLSSKIIDTDISDHLPIVAEIEF